MKKNNFTIFIILILALIILVWKNYISNNILWLEIEKITTTSDIDNDWINDIDDILEWARREVKNKTNYKSWYYAGWYPPDNEWVCTDVVWRALKNAWIDLKTKVDNDIKFHTSLYPRVEWKPDPNIDFRRVPNLDIFLKRNAKSLTTEVIPWNTQNLKEWQAWDIVIFWKPKDHIAIISDKRNREGVPYIIHNSAPTPREDNRLLYWHENISPIIGHYRWIY